MDESGMVAEAAQLTPVAGVAAGVPYLALQPTDRAEGAPLVLVLHLMDPPRSEAAMAAAVPMVGVRAWRAYLGLPLFGARLPAGGQEEVMRLAQQDPLLSLIAPIVEQAADELPAALHALRKQLSVDESPIGLVGGSAGAAAALLALAQRRVPVVAAALINAAVRAADVIATGERMFGVPYGWTSDSRRVAERLDFVRRADQIAAADPQPAVLLVNGADDDPSFLRSADALYDALSTRYTSRDRVAKVRVPGLAHALAEEPGLEPAPQTPGAMQVDAAVTKWLSGPLARPRRSSF